MIDAEMNMTVIDGPAIGREFFALVQNYLNPFNAVTTIRYRVSAIGYLRMALYDQLGRGGGILVDESRMPGRYEETCDASRFSGGV